MKDDLLVLCYHGVGDEWVSHLTVRTSALEAQLSYLVDRGYRSTTFTNLVTERPSGRVVAVTFDDGFRSVLELALPIVKRYGMIATVFVPTDYVETGAVATWPGMERWLTREQERHLRILSWGEVRTLAESGWEIGSHTRSHARLRDLADDELDWELRGSRLICEEKLQQPCRSLAYPYGGPEIDFDLRTARAAGAAGYEAAGTIPRRWAPPEPLLWPRVSIGASDSLLTFRAKVSPAMRSFRATSAWRAVDAPRRVVRDRLIRMSIGRRLTKLDAHAASEETPDRSQSPGRLEA